MITTTKSLKQYIFCLSIGFGFFDPIKVKHLLRRHSFTFQLEIE